jgi:hypothetical protein
MRRPRSGNKFSGCQQLARGVGRAPDGSAKEVMTAEIFWRQTLFARTELVSLLPARPSIVGQLPLD